MVYLTVAGLYLLVLLPRLVMDTGRFPDPRAYLLEFRFASPARLMADVLLNLAAFVPLGWLLFRGLRDLGSSPVARGLGVVGLCAGLSLCLPNTLGTSVRVALAERWDRA